jgi:hypothetical protein
MQKHHKGAWRWFFDISKEAREKGDAAVSLIGTVITIVAALLWLIGYHDQSAVEEKATAGLALFGVVLTVGALLNCARKRCQNLEDELEEYKGKKLLLSRSVTDDYERGNFREFLVEITTNYLLGIDECECRMVRIEHAGVAIKTTPFSLMWHPNPQPLERRKLLRGTPLLVYILGIRTVPSEIPIILHSAHRKKVIADDGSDIPKTYGEYLFTIAMSGTGAEVVEERLKFNWTGDYQTSTLEKI